MLDDLYPVDPAIVGVVDFVGQHQHIWIMRQVT